jgi:hypothetical protein
MCHACKAHEKIPRLTASDILGLDFGCCSVEGGGAVSGEEVEGKGREVTRRIMIGSEANARIASSVLFDSSSGIIG